MMITLMEVDLGEDFSMDNLIKQDVDEGQWIFVLNSESIQGLVVHT
jgi:hypothetical protein